MAKGKNPKHTACRPGKQVLVKLIDGTRIIDIFVKRKHGVIYLKEYGKVPKSKMFSFQVIRK